MSSNFSNNVGQAKINYIYNTTGVNKLLSNLDTFSIWSATASGITITLPDPSNTFAGWSVKIKNDSTGQITVSGGGFNIDGVASIVLNPKDMVEITNDGTAVNSIISKYTYSQLKHLINYGASQIIDGNFTRTTILSASTTYLNFNTNQYALWQANVPEDYVLQTDLTATIDFVTNTTTAGDYTWYLYWTALGDGDVINTVPTPPTLSGTGWNGATITVASSAVIDTRQRISFTIPDGGAGISFAPGKTLLFKLIMTASPTATRGGVLDVDSHYYGYVDFSY